MNFIEIQTWPEIPQIAFFSSLFSQSFRLPEFDIEVEYNCDRCMASGGGRLLKQRLPARWTHTNRQHTDTLLCYFFSP
jgi:hypothetical protein